MTVTLKLFASLSAYLPAEARARHAVTVDVEPGATVLDVLTRQGIPEAACALVLVDGVWVPPRERAQRALTQGEVLAVWPPVAGGSSTG